jgi:hypothetical protein
MIWAGWPQATSGLELINLRRIPLTIDVDWVTGRESHQLIEFVVLWLPFAILDENHELDVSLETFDRPVCFEM